MALKYVIDSKAELEALPAALQQEYVEKDGKFVIAVDGVVPASELAAEKDRVKEFRTNNLQLADEVKRLRPLEGEIAKFAGIDPGRYNELIEKDKGLKGKGVKDADDIQKLVTEAVSAAVAPLNQSLEQERQARLTAEENGRKARFRELLSADATKARVRPSALRHVLAEADALFELKDGRVAPKNPDEVPSVEAWLGDLYKREDYLFEPSSGGGAGGGNNGHDNGARPGARILRNPSAEEKGKYAREIGKGEMVVVYE